MRRILWLVAIVLLGLPAQAAEIDSGLAFFNEYVKRSNAHDPEIAALFSDSARIITLRDGEKRLELTGKQWKELIPRAMPIAAKRGDTSTFEDVKAVPHGEGLRITATRMPVVKCVVDENYHVDLVPVDDSWRIVEEYTETVSLSQCEPSDELARKLAAVREGILPHLPIDLDSETKLEQVEVVGPAIIYSQRIHTMSASELDPAETTQALQQLGFQYACGAPEMKALVDAGATVRYATVDKDGTTLANVDIQPGMCP